MARKRTFGELKEGSYVYTAGRGSVSRVSVVYINYNPMPVTEYAGKVRMACGHFRSLEAIVDASATEHIDANHHWFTSKDDARRCAYQLLLEQIRDTENALKFLKERADYYKRNYIDTLK
jgi:hypothetical protein